MIASSVLSALLVLIAWIWLRLARREVSIPLWSTLEIPALPATDTPFVSVILPCRNHIHTIVRSVRSLLRQSYPRFEVVVVDDQSSDGTWEQLLQLQASEPQILRVLRAEQPGGGCRGVPGALQQGVEVARGHWLLFTEAEAYHAPDLLNRAMAYASWRGLGMLSLSPRHECRTFWEHVCQPLLVQYTDLMMPMARVADPTTREAWASPAFLLIAREVYRDAGGYAGMASDFLPEFALARRVKGLEYRIEFVKAMDLLQVRLYRSFRELWDGWSTHLYGLLGARPLVVAGQATAIWAWTVLPFAAIVPAFAFGFGGLDAVEGWWDVLLAVSTILAVVTILQSQSILRRVHRQNHLYAITLPLGGLWLGAAAINALVRRAVTRDVRWRGRPCQMQER